MKENLKQQLLNWDGVHIGYLLDIYVNIKNDLYSFDEIIDYYLLETELQKVTSWLIKHHYDTKNQLTESQIEKILSASNRLKDWEGQLHILQLIPKFNIDKNIASKIKSFVRKSMTSEKKFVKAAAYEAYFEIVKCIPELLSEFKLLCEESLVKESASIRSKIKKILLKFEEC